jgi:signal transduction histidine kinase
MANDQPNPIHASKSDLDGEISQITKDRQRLEESETLRTVISALTSTLELDQLLNLILEQLSIVLEFDSATIFLLDDTVLRGMACLGLPEPEKVIGKPFPVNDKLFQYVLAQGKPVYLSDASIDERFLGWGGTQDIHGWMGVPLVARGQFIGYMTLDSYQKSLYGSKDINKILPFAHQAAQAIDNARLYDRAQNTADELKVTLEKLKETQQQLVQQERLAAVGQLAAGIAHDFNNILAVIVLYSQLLQRTANLSHVDQTRVQTIVEQGERATGLIQQILDFSRKSIIERRPLSLPPFLDNIEKLLKRTLPETIQVSVLYDNGTYEIRADQTSIQQLLMNLAVNARDAMPNGGTLQFLLESLIIQPGKKPPVPEMHAGEWIVIHVKDSGSGMSPEVQKKVFEPFFTTKEPGKGTGLGLAQAYGIVRQHEGFIHCESQQGLGTEFFVYFPVFNLADDDDVERKTAVSKGSGQTVLVVEDNPAALTVIEEILHMLNYKVLVAENGEKALSVLAQTHDVAVVLSDVVMPEMGGFALYKKISASYPQVKIVLMSGYTRELEQPFWSANQEVAWLRKPFSIESLAETMRQTLSEE